MIEYTQICMNIPLLFLYYSKAKVSKNRFITHIRATIIKIAISRQVTVIFQMRGVIQFTDVNWFIIVRIFFEVKTDTIVVQVAQKLTIIKVLDFSCFDYMVYQSSFSKEIVVRKHHSRSRSKIDKLKYDYSTYFPSKKKMTF